MAEFCTICGKNLALVGRAHICAPKEHVVAAEAKSAAEPAVETKPEAASVTNTAPDVTNSVTNSKPRLTNSGKTTYRYRDADKWRAYMRAYMAERRKASR